MTAETYEPVSIHLASAAAGLLDGAAARRCKHRAVFRTAVLTASEPVNQILPADPGRIMAWVQAGGNDVVLCTSKGDAQANANTADTSLANPTGTLLPYTNTAPYPIDTNSAVWAAAAAYPTQVAVTAIYEVSE